MASKGFSRFRGMIGLATAGLIALSLGVAAAARAQEIQTPLKFIKIVNDSNVTLFPILYIGATDADDWMRAKFQVGPNALKTKTYARKLIYRSYVGDYGMQGGKQVFKGMAPGATLYVQVPFYSKLVQKPNPALPDQYIDWWNGGRVFFYDVEKQVTADFEKDTAHKVTLLSAGVKSCDALNADETACVSPRNLPVFSATDGYPPTDLSQLIEYTFADAITANGAPYPLVYKKVGYNISSVDQAYLPLAMEPLGNPFVPYIGTTIGIGTFRSKINEFLTDYPGWPVYYTDGGVVDKDHPRVPGAYNVYASKVDLTPPGKAVRDMTALYRKCVPTTTDTSDFCVNYRKIYALFLQNWVNYKKLSCSQNIKFNDLIVSKIYGWVPFNEGCGAGVNSLLNSAGSAAKLANLQAIYTDRMQYSTAVLYNPYVHLIHDAAYLDMAAYAFSVDDAIGFQSYLGTGLILDFGGNKGLDDKNKLNLGDKVTVTLGKADQPNVPKWKRYGVCSNSADTDLIDNNFPVFDLFPQKYPCRITLTDRADKIYRFDILTGPRPKNSGMTVKCVTGSQAFCAGVQVPTNVPQGVSTPPPDVQ